MICSLWREEIGWGDFDLAKQEIAELELQIDRAKYLGFEKEAETLQRLQGELIGNFSTDAKSLATTRGRITKTINSMSSTEVDKAIGKLETKGSELSVANKTKLEELKRRRTILSNRNEAAIGNKLNSNRSLAYRGIATSAIRVAAVTQIASEVVSLGLRGVWKLSNAASKAMDTWGRREFGTGRAISTENASTERQRALQLIQSNRMQASSYLGMEALMRSQAGYN